MLAQQRTELAVTRTVMAADRTLMAWTRTSLTMISFGFTVYKFMQYMQEEGRAILARTERGAQNFGLTLIAVGILSLLIACVQYGHLARKIDSGRKWHFSLSLVVAGFVVAFGLLALVNAIFRIGPF
ncbi:MAG: YidH family protein [Solirubrobacterales bacterium]